MASTGTRPRPAYGEARNALLNAVARVVARGGLRAATYRAVAKEAGVSHGAVSLHFGSRDVMIREAYSHAIAHEIARSGLEPQTGAIADFVANLPQAVEDNPESLLFQYELMLEAGRQPKLAEANRSQYRAFVEAAERELDRAGLKDDPALARFTAAALEGVVFHQVVGLSTREQVEEELERFREMLQAVLLIRAGDNKRLARDRR